MVDIYMSTRKLLTTFVHCVTRHAYYHIYFQVLLLYIMR
jgi:hypothetical protein